MTILLQKMGGDKKSNHLFVRINIRNTLRRLVRNSFQAKLNLHFVSISNSNRQIQIFV
jgi:hypothetical protein